MKCPYCNKDVKDGMKFCTNCGKEISVSHIKTSTSSDVPEWKKHMGSDTPKTSEPPKITTPPPFSTPPTSTEGRSELRDAMSDVATALEKKLGDGPRKYTIPAHLSPDIIMPCDSEVPVRQYVFSKMRFPFFRYIADGVLQVTNKRIIYNLIGSSLAGNERTHSEFSIDDVAGISVEKSVTMNLLSIVVYILLGFPLFAFCAQIGGINNVLTMFIGIIGVLVSLFMFKTKHYGIMHFVCAGCCDALIYSNLMGTLKSWGASYGVTLDNNTFNNIVSTISALLIYYFIAMNLLSYFKSLMKNTISVVITSKSGSATPINCSQMSKVSFSAGQIRSFCDNQPTVDTDTMIQELGAMVMDIQKQGDYAIEKWRK